MAGVEDPDHGDCLAAIRFWCAALMHYEEMIKRGSLSPALDDMPWYRSLKRINSTSTDRTENVNVGVERIYVAGPISADTDEDVQANYRRGQEIGEQLRQLGHMVFVPHNYVLLYRGSHRLPQDVYDQLLTFDFSIIENWATALYFIAPSPGANRERVLAEKLGLKIFSDISDVLDLSKQDNRRGES